jgi:rhamnogalacturonan acetylesterase
MKRRLNLIVALGFLLGIAGASVAEEAPPGRLPTLYIIGDSTVKNGSGKGADGLWGWGDPIAGYFDKSRISVVNRALGGRSSRTYLTEGLWAKVVAEMKAGDFVLMQFGHNDGGSLTQSKGRASIKGNGEETQEVTDEKSGKKEMVHTYGWYMRKYIADAKAKGATAIVLSPIPRNMWKGEKVSRASGDYGKWAAEAAKDQGVAFIDLNELIAARYEAMGEEKVKAFFPGDHTHTNQAGARMNAAVVVEGIRALKDCPLRDFLSATPPTEAKEN